jgi:hypothetical protein
MPNQTMIERIAEALCPSAFTGKFLSKNAQGAEQAKALASARAVLSAMREPTEEMMKAKAKDDIGGDAPVAGYLDYLSADDVWRAMIDAAREEGR